MVVPQLKSITVGGAVAGIGIEATSFRHGLVHETVLEMDVALPDGRIVTCTPDNEHADLFAGMPNSYGTLGYATRLRIETMPVKSYVEIRHRHFDDRGEFFAALGAGYDDAGIDFLDGVAFGASDLVLTSGAVRRQRPEGERLHLRGHLLRVPAHPGDGLHDRGRLHLALGHRLVLVLQEPGCPSSPSSVGCSAGSAWDPGSTSRVMRWNSRWRLLETAERLAGYRRESIIQDVDLPLATAPEFLGLFVREIGIVPVWICPVRNRSGISSPLFPAPADRYVNFGFWDTLRFGIGYPPGHFNRIVEQAVTDLGGIKSLYSSSFYTEREFHRIYGGEAYRGAKGELRSPGYARRVVRQMRASPLSYRLLGPGVVGATLAVARIRSTRATARVAPYDGAASRLVGLRRSFARRVVQRNAGENLPSRMANHEFIEQVI